MSTIERLPPIEERTAPHWKRFLSDSLLAVAGALLITGIIDALHLYPRIPNISFAYLLVVLALASRRGLYAAILASVVAFLSFDYFLVPPLYTLRIDHVEEWLALFFFLVVAIITAQFAAALRWRAEEAQRRERETRTLYDLVRVTNQEEDLSRQLNIVALAVVDVFSSWGVRACAILLPDERGKLVVRASAGSLPAGEREKLSPDEEATAARVLAQGQAMGLHDVPRTSQLSAHTLRVLVRSTAAIQQAHRSIRFFPLKAGQKGLGVLRVLIEKDPRWLGTDPLMSMEQERLNPRTAFFWTFLEQAGTMIERARLRQESMQVEVLQRTDALRVALLSSVSHDLRTPLSSIKAAASSLLQDDVQWDENTRRGFAGTIEREADRLNRLVENLLDMSRIEAGALKPEKEWYELPALIQDVLGHLQPLLHGRAVQTSLPDDLPPVKMDYLQIAQVLTNLLENAVRYTPTGSPIEISAEAQDGQLLVSVADRGPGIPPEELERIFDKFYRVRTLQRDTSGSGLGLAVCRGLVEAHGGRIWAENREGGGALFRFTLPLKSTEG
jgi:two-component system, OmpR family, sensor histidine kinase KdpD